MQPAEALPPVRELAQKLKVSPATVAAAYRLLRARGLTAANGRRGTRVIPRPPTRARSDLRPVAEGATDLSSGNPDGALLPSLAPALQQLDATAALYDAPPLLPSLASFAAAEFEADGIAAAALTAVSGALDAIERVLREHLRPGDHVALEDPCFPSVHDLLVAAGYVAVPFAVDDEGPEPASFEAALRQNCRAAIVTTRGQNPTGAALTGQRAEKLRAALRRHPDLLLIESDPCGPVAGAPPITLVDRSRHRWAHVKSTAKFLGPDLRVAFVAGDALTINRVEGRYVLGPRRVSHLLQRLVLALWSDPSAGRRLARASEVYRHRRTALLTELAAHGVAARGASGLNVWVPVRDESHSVHALAARGWIVAAGEPFRIQATPGIRITTAALRPEAAPELAATLADVLSSVHRPTA